MKRLLVIGGGLAGLSAAWEAKRAGAAVRILEISRNPGGVIQSEREDGFLYETGPNTLMASDPEFAQLLNDLGLAEEIAEAAPAARERFIVREGRLVPVPMSPGKLLATPLLSVAAKLRLLGEPLARKRQPGAGEESLADFARRRFGVEVFSYGLEPMVAGIFAGDPEKLAVQHAFPRLQKMEQEHGSLIRAGWRALRQRRDSSPRRLISFHNGIAALPRALAGQLGNALQSEAKLISLCHNASGHWTAAWQSPTGHQQEEFDALVLAVPAYALGELPLPADLSSQLRPLAKIEYPPVSAVILGFPRHAVGHALDGFGALVPRVENMSVLGILFNSTLFPGRAPTGQVLLTTFVGGARQPELARLPDDQLAALVRKDLEKLLSTSGLPVFQKIIRWPRAIPQYNLGHGAMLAAIETIEGAMSGLALAGSYRGGVSVPQCIVTGRAAAWRALNLSPNTPK